MINVSNQYRIINSVNQIVKVDGSVSNYIKCTGCSLQGAEFNVVGKRFDDNYKYWLQDKLVTVFVNNYCLFTGFIQTTNSVCSPTDDGFNLQATPVSSILSDTWIGQYTNKNVLTYKASDDWTLSKILDDLFDQLGEMKQYIKLGNTSILDNNKFAYGKELIIRNCTYEEAIDQILEFTGTIIFRPTFTSNGCVINFYDSANPNNGNAICSLADSGSDSKNDNLQSITISDTSLDYVDQISLWGVRQAIITVYGNFPTDTVSPELQLIPDWEPAYTDIVRKNPEISKEGSPGFVEGFQYVDRRYKLPKVLWDFLKLDNLPIRKPKRNPDGTIIPITDDDKLNNRNTDYDYYNLQAFQWKSHLKIDETGDVMAVAEPDTLPSLVNVVWDLDNNTVTFSEATTNFLTVDKTNKNLPAQTFTQAPIGITIAIELTDNVFNYKTGADKKFAKNINVLKEDFKFVQYTNIGFPIKDNIVFGNGYVFTEDISPPELYAFNDAIIIQNDIGLMQQLANDLLQSKNHRPKQINVRLPYISNHFAIGKKLIINNLASSEMNNDKFIITDVNFDLVNYSIDVTADNSKPLKYSEI